MTKSMNKKVESFLKNEKAQMGGVGTLYAVFFAAIVVLAIIIIFTFIPGIGSTVQQSTPAPPAYGSPGGEWNTTAVSDIAATGSYVFSTNVSNGELANITSGSNVYRFEFNTTANGSAATCIIANCIVVNLTVGYNTSVKASGNLTSAINANASTSVLVTAVNTTNKTTLTANTAGTSGNSIVLSTNAIGIVASGLSGGTAKNPNAEALAASSGAAIWTSTSGMLKVAMIIGIVVIILGSLFAIFAARRAEQGGGGGGPM